MPRNLRITRIVVTHFSFVVNDLGPEEHLGFDKVYRPGYRLDRDGSILSIETDAGITGEVPGSIDRRDALYMLGRNPLERDTIWHDLKRAQRGWMNAPNGAIDMALWDIAGKLYGAPIHELLGGGGQGRMKLPCYASTYHGDENGGLTRPEDYGDFALACRDRLGYSAFKIHGWVGGRSVAKSMRYSRYAGQLATAWRSCLTLQVHSEPLTMSCGSDARATKRTTSGTKTPSAEEDFRSRPMRSYASSSRHPS